MQVQLNQSRYLAPSMLLGPAPSRIRIATPDRGGNQLVLVDRCLVVRRFVEQR